VYAIGNASVTLQAEPSKKRNKKEIKRNKNETKKE
jgi:hypothetical protein